MHCIEARKLTSALVHPPSLAVTPPLARSLLRLPGALSGMVSAASYGRCGHGATHLSPTQSFTLAPYPLSEAGNPALVSGLLNLS